MFRIGGEYMPLSRSVAKFNQKVTNRLMGRLAPYLPGLGVITHVGRKSGRSYSTPINVFKRGDSYIVALTYGTGADWTRNVLASGGCTLKTRGRTVQLTNARLFHDESRRLMPFPARIILGLVGVNDFLQLDIVKRAV